MLTKPRLEWFQKRIFKIWEKRGCKPKRIPALPVGSLDSEIVVVGKEYAKIAEVRALKKRLVLPDGTQINLWAARAFAEAHAFGDSPKSLFTSGSTISCHFRYYGIWRWVAKEQRGSRRHPLFCELSPLGKKRDPAAKETIELLRLLNRKRQIIVLNGVDVRNEGFFKRKKSETKKLRQKLEDELAQKLEDIWGVWPKNKNWPFVTRSGFVCLRTYHSAGRGGTLESGHLLEAVRLCLKFANESP